MAKKKKPIKRGPKSARKHTPDRNLRRTSHQKKTERFRRNAKRRRADAGHADADFRERILATQAEPTAIELQAWQEIDDLFHKVLDLFYGKRGREKAFSSALRLLRLLNKYDPHAETLVGMSGQWLVAELDGDLEEAIRYREKEIRVLRKEIARGLLENGSLRPNAFADRLDLLASNYIDAKRYSDALAVLNESETFCAEHAIPFDGQEIHTDLKRVKGQRKRATA